MKYIKKMIPFFVLMLIPIMIAMIPTPTGISTSALLVTEDVNPVNISAVILIHYTSFL